jgi:hypothetical protein
MAIVWRSTLEILNLALAPFMRKKELAVGLPNNKHILLHRWSTGDPLRSRSGAQACAVNCALLYVE